VTLMRVGFVRAGGSWFGRFIRAVCGGEACRLLQRNERVRCTSTARYGSKAVDNNVVCQGLKDLRCGTPYHITVSYADEKEKVCRSRWSCPKLEPGREKIGFLGSNLCSPSQPVNLQTVNHFWRHNNINKTGFSSHKKYLF
jgi:hypothetical protein